MDKSRVKPTIFFIEKISFSSKLFSGHFYGQSFIKTVRGPCSHLSIIHFKIFEKILSGGLEVSFSIYGPRREETCLRGF